MANSSSSASSSARRSQDSSSPSSEWSVDEKGIYTGPGKHYGDTQPKVWVSSVHEAVRLIREVDPTAKLPKETDKIEAPLSVPSHTDTVNTEIVEVGGKTVISGPLARVIASMRGLQLLGAGEGNPVTFAPEPPPNTPMAAAPKAKIMSRKARS